VDGCKHALPHSGVKFAILDSDLIFNQIFLFDSSSESC